MQSASKVDELLLKSATVTELNDNTFTWGAEFKQQSISVDNSRLQSCNSDFEACLPTSFGVIVKDITEVDVNFVSAFVDYQMPLSQNWQANLGAAIDRNDFTDQTFVEPRVSLSYEVSDSSRLGFSLGQYHQWFRDLNYLSPVFGNPDLELNTANMIGANFQQELADGWQWESDVYYKQLDTELLLIQPVNKPILMPARPSPYRNTLTKVKVRRGALKL